MIKSFIKDHGLPTHGL